LTEEVEEEEEGDVGGDGAFKRGGLGRAQLGVRLLGLFMCSEAVARSPEAVPLAWAAVRAAVRVGEEEVARDAGDVVVRALAAAVDEGGGGGSLSDRDGEAVAGMVEGLGRLVGAVSGPEASGAVARGLAIATTVGVGEGVAGVAAAAGAAVGPLCGALGAAVSKKEAALALDLLQALAAALAAVTADERAALDMGLHVAPQEVARPAAPLPAWAGEARDALASLLRSRLDVGPRDAALRCCWALAGSRMGAGGHWLCDGGEGELLVVATRVAAVEAKVLMHMVVGAHDRERVRVLLPEVLQLLVIAVDAVAAAMEALDSTEAHLVSEACIDKAFPALQDAAGTCVEFLMLVVAGKKDIEVDDEVVFAACTLLGAYSREVQGEHDAALRKLGPLFDRLGVPSPLDEE